MTVAQLSPADSRVLLQVFDPESGPGVAEIIINPRLPADRHIQDPEDLANLKQCEGAAIALIEDYESAYSRSASKDVVYRSALNMLDDLIRSHPRYASARNNRAQLRRWRFGDRNMLCQQKARMDAERKVAALAITEDLKSCITLSIPTRPNDAVSPTQGRLLAQAYTQLAALYYAVAKDLDSQAVVEIVQSESSFQSKHEFEEEASRLFHLGGLYGNEVAKALAVYTNPHARLCGNIVKEAMRKELTGR